MVDEQMWKEMLGTLKDISTYLEKSEDISKADVISQERAKVDKPPIARETDDPITGGPAASNKPAAGVAKEYIDIPDTTDKKTEEIDSSGGTMLKADDDDDEDEDSDDGEESSESEESSDTEELKSLLKDIRSALAEQTAIVKSEIKKAMPDVVKTEVSKQLDKTLRKMGYHPTRSDVTRLSGIDAISEVKKSEDAKIEGDIKKAEGTKDEFVDAVKQLEKFDLRQLGQLREKAGLFRPFGS